MTTLEDIRELEHGASFPGEVIRASKTALVLFAAQWLGKQDAYWVAAEGLIGTCVDLQADKLKQMEEIYPEGWEFLCADVFSFTETTDRVWDVVSIDCPTVAFQRCADLLPRWCSLARHAVILGSGWDTTVVAPEGWRVEDVRRRSDYFGGVFWTVLVPA